MKIKLLLIVVIWLMIVASTFSLSLAQGVFPVEDGVEVIELPKADTKPEWVSSLIFLLLLFLPVPIFSMLLVVLIKFKISPTWIGGIIGGFYALIPSSLTLYWIFIKGSLGDPGPFWPFALLPFWPQGLTLLISGIISELIFGSFFNYQLMYVLMSAINILLWIFIGIGIGYLINEKVNRSDIELLKRKPKFILLGGAMGLLLGGGIIYMALTPANFFGFILYLLISMLIGMLISFILTKLLKK